MRSRLSTIVEGDSNYNSQVSSSQYTSRQNSIVVDEMKERIIEARCLEVQDLMGVKVSKYGRLYKRKGYVLTQYKEFEIFLLSNGLLLFYTLTENSKKYGQESRLHRIQLDESMKIENVTYEYSSDLESRIEKFHLII